MKAKMGAACAMVLPKLAVGVSCLIDMLILQAGAFCRATVQRARGQAKRD
jgi:hypothetical protein